jgi:hypothetical protein
MLAFGNIHVVERARQQFSNYSVSPPRSPPAAVRPASCRARREWHLGKVFTKLSVGSRRELRSALASLGQADPRA